MLGSKAAAQQVQIWCAQAPSQENKALVNRGVIVTASEATAVRREEQLLYVGR